MLNESAQHLSYGFEQTTELEAGIEVEGMSAGASTSITNELMLGHDSVATNARSKAQNDYSYSFSMSTHASLYSAMLKWNEVEVKYKDNFLSDVTKMNEAFVNSGPQGAATIFNFIRKWGTHVITKMKVGAYCEQTIYAGSTASREQATDFRSDVNNARASWLWFQGESSSSDQHSTEGTTESGVSYLIDNIKCFG